MEHIDEKLQERVWQRVRGGGQAAPDPTALSDLISQELADAADCISLSRRLGGRGAELLRLAREDQAHAGCLRGICSLITGSPPQTPSPVPETATAQAVLRRCYVRHLHRLREYESRASDPDFGPAFQKMAAEERNHCAVLLELVGKL